VDPKTPAVINMNAMKSSRPMITALVDFLSSSLCLPFKDSCGLLLLLLMFFLLMFLLLMLLLLMFLLLLMLLLLLRELRLICRRRECDIFRFSPFSRQPLSRDILRTHDIGDADGNDDSWFWGWGWLRVSVDMVEADVLVLSLLLSSVILGAMFFFLS
jgi:hypothetical protein